MDNSNSKLSEKFGSVSVKCICPGNFRKIKLNKTISFSFLVKDIKCLGFF